MSTEAVFRLSAGYDLHAGAVMITPYANADVVGRSTRTVSLGLCVGWMF